MIKYRFVLISPFTYPQLPIPNPQSPTRILHLITRLIFGGAQHNTVLTCAAQVAAGHDVHLCIGPTFGPEGSLVEEAEASGAVMHHEPTLVREASVAKDALCYRALRRLIRAVDPDVVHTHSSKAGILGRAAAWREGGKQGRRAVVHTVHGLGFHDRQHPLTRKLYIQLERYAAKRCHRLIAITPQMVDAFAEHRIAPRERFTVVPSGVQLDRFAPSPPGVRAAVREQYNIPADAAVVGLLGRLDALKGQRDLIEVYPRLSAALTGRPVHLLFIGDGFDRANVERAIASAGLGDRATITGLLPYGELSRVLSALDVSVLPSYQEGQSRTLVESLLCGVPVVGYAAGGIPSIIQDGKTGRLVPVGDKPALVQAVVEVLAHPEAAARMADAGAAHVRTHFDVAPMADTIQSVYDLALEDAAQKRR
ncbi:MAG: glycosyltransferase [Planctomycetota bacterium]